MGFLKKLWNIGANNLQKAATVQKPSTQPVPDSYSGLHIVPKAVPGEPSQMGYSMAYISDHPHDLYPWSNDNAKMGLSIGEAVILWWFGRNPQKDKTFPKYFSNYTEDVYVAINHFSQLGYITKDYKVTDVGEMAVTENSEYIQLHRQHWITDKEHAAMKKARDSMYIEHSKNLRRMGLNDLAAENDKVFAKEQAQDRYFVKFEAGEKLSKAGDATASLNKLLPLLKSKQRTSELYWRIAINYRKLKQYDDEVQILQQALQPNEMPWWARSKEEVQKRLAWAIELRDKQAKN